MRRLACGNISRGIIVLLLFSFLERFQQHFAWGWSSWSSTDVVGRWRRHQQSSSLRLKALDQHSQQHQSPNHQQDKNLHRMPAVVILSSRRDLILRLVAVGGVATATITTTSYIAWAEDSISTISDKDASTTSNLSTKPFAPLDKLLPAARVKYNIEKALQIVESMSDDDDDDRWDQLQILLLLPQNYTGGLVSEIPVAPAKAYLDTYQRNRQSLQLLAQPGAILVQSGEIAAWKRLKRQEQQQERKDEIRAALNLYTSALNFNAESYLLNVPVAERKQMIRQDRLPDIKQVIQSDMGMRYLYRNELLTAMEQVRGELEYQLGLTATTRTGGSSSSNKSKQELLPLLQQACNACNQWFALVDERDVEEAMSVVAKEKKEATR